MVKFLSIAVCSLLLATPFSKAALSKKINSGDTIYSILQKHSFSQKQVRKILGQQIIPKSLTLVPGKQYHVEKMGKHEARIKFYHPDNDYSFIFIRQGDLAEVKKVKTKYRIVTETASGSINGSLIASIMKQAPYKEVAYRFMDAFVYKYKLRKAVKRGDKFKLTYEKKFDGSRFIKTGEVLMAELTLQGKKVTRYYIPFEGGGAFIGSDWDQNYRPLYSPADYATFSSLFTYRRKHPVTGRVKAHLGIDYELPVKAPIYAAEAGKVLRMGRNRAAGRYVVLRHTNGLESYYNHMSSIDSKIKKGSYVKSGQLIGGNGCTGYCTKPHLHFAVKKNGRWVDPIKLVKSYPYHKRFAARKMAKRLKDNPNVAVK